MIERRFADTAFLREVGNREATLPIARYIFDSTLQRLIDLHVARLHLDYNALQKAIKARIRLECLKLSAREELCDVNNVALLGLADVDYLRLVLIALIMHKAADVDHLYVGIAPPFGIAVDIFGDKDRVALCHRKLFIKIDIVSAALPYDADSGLSSVTVSSAEMVYLKDVT